MLFLVTDTRCDVRYNLIVAIYLSGTIFTARQARRRCAGLKNHLCFLGASLSGKNRRQHDINSAALVPVCDNTKTPRVMTCCHHNLFQYHLFHLFQLQSTRPALGGSVFVNLMICKFDDLQKLTLLRHPLGPTAKSPEPAHQAALDALGTIKRHGHETKCFRFAVGRLRLKFPPPDG